MFIDMSKHAVLDNYLLVLPIFPHADMSYMHNLSYEHSVHTFYYIFFFTNIINLP